MKQTRHTIKTDSTHESMRQKRAGIKSAKQPRATSTQHGKLNPQEHEAAAVHSSMKQTEPTIKTDSTHERMKQKRAGIKTANQPRATWRSMET